MEVTNLAPAEAVKLHRDFIRTPEGQFPEWGRNWIVAAVTEGSSVHEQYRKMEWDLDADVSKAAHSLRAGTGYSSEELAYDLRQLWRRLLRNYAFLDAIAMEPTIWQAEKQVWNSLGKEDKRERGHPALFRLWRLKDLLVWRLGIAVMAGYALLASSSGLMDILKAVHCAPYWWLALAWELIAAFSLALVEVQRRVGRRRWMVLWRRAGGITAWGAICTLPEALTQCWLGPKLHFDAPPQFAALCAASALLLGLIFQLFWQERSTAEPL